MSKKNLYLGITLIVLIAAAYIYNGPLQKWQSEKDRSVNFLSGLKIEQIDAIDISTGGKTITLEKAADKWKIKGTKDFYVDSALANELAIKLGEVAKAEIELISENKEKKADFQLNEESGAAVKLRQGENVAYEFLIGKQGTDFNSTYISKAGDDKSYLVKTALSELFLRGEWFDKTIFASDQEKINKIRFQYPNREFTIEKGEAGWTGTLPYKFPVSEEKIKNILALAANLEAAEIPEQKFAGTDLEKNLIIVEVSGENIKNTLMIGGPKSKDDKSAYFAKKADADNIYLISKEQRDDFDVSIGGLK
jgi:hypothetical protein